MTPQVQPERITDMRKVLLLATLLYVAAPIVLAQDPIKVDSKHYSVLLDNDQVRVLKIRYGPKEKSVMHEHPDAVAVFLNDSTVKFNMPDGTSTPSEGKAGQVLFTPAGKHLPENVGGKPFDVVLVELKGAAATTPKIDADPVTIDPEHHKVEFENDRVRVLRINFKPHEKLKEHEHPNGVAIFMTDVKSKFTLTDGKTREGGGKRGEVTWAAAEKHVIENASNKPTEVILVELKR
jgi:quercetin dioxygenase-like cupin family protein